MAQATCDHTTISAALRARIMSRAWAIFREKYNYPRVPFRSIGKACFAWALKMAWHEARETARLAAEGIERLRSGLVAIETPRHRVGLSTSYTGRAEEIVARANTVRLYRAALELAVAA